MPPVWTFTRLTLREAWRSKLLALAFGLTLLYIGLVAWGVSKLVEHSRNPLNTLASSAALEVLAFFLGSFMVTLLAVFVAGHSTRQEAESGLLQAILTKPIRRFDVVAGRWLGSAMLLAAYVALFSAGVVAAVGLQVGYYPPSATLAGALLLLEGLVVLSLRILFGSFLGTLASGIAPLMVYGLGWMGGMVEQAGSVLHIASMATGGVITSLVVPTDVLWRGASYYLLPEVARLASEAGADLGNGNPVVSLTPIAGPMVLWAAAYVVAMFAIGTRIFSRRDV